MGSFVLSALLISLGICFVPVYLLRRQAFLRTQDLIISSQPTPPNVIRNCSTAYALKLVIFGLFFGWGVSGDFWPACISAACYSLGWGLILVLRRRIIEFMDSALHNDQSITVHEFITRQHGNDSRVRLLSSSLTLLALLAVLVAEAMAVAAFLQPLQLGGNASVELAIAGVLVLMASYAALSGNSGVMQSVQLQFGMMYLGLFGITALLLYIHVSELTPLPPHGLFAMLISAGCCVFILFYRRSKYVDTAPVRMSDNPRDENSSESLTPKLLRRFGKVLNPGISVFASLIIVLAGMGFTFAGLPAIERSSVAALQAGTHMTNAGWIALILLPLFYPIADVTNWQRIAVAAKNYASDNNSWLSRRTWRRISGVVEAPLLWLFTWALGALAAVATGPSDGFGAAQRLVEQLVSEQNDVTTVALWLLFLCVFAMALAAMISIFSACLCTIRYDILPGFMTGLHIPGAKPAPFVLGSGLLLVIPIAVFILGAWSVGFTSTAFLRVLFALCCAQLSLIPLVLGPLVFRTREGFSTVSGPWALAVLCAGAGSAVSALTIYLMTGREAWLWTAAPACLGSALLLFTLGRLFSEKTV